MDDPEIVLRLNAYPQEDDDHRCLKILRDPAFCGVCCNFWPGSAYSLVPREDIHYLESDITLNELQNDPNYQMYSGKQAPKWLEQACLASWGIRAALQDVVNAAKGGCPSCKLLLVGLTKSSNGVFSSDDTNIRLDIVFCLGDVLRVWIYRDTFDVEEDVGIFGDLNLQDEHSQDELLMRLEFYTLPGQPCPWNTIGSSMKLEAPFDAGLTKPGGPTRHILPTPDAARVAKLVEPWLNECQSRHISCKSAAHTGNVELPKRFIHVGDEDNTNIHLVQLDGCGDSEITYVALSHCWGRSQHLVSTKDSVEGWKRNIPWAKLPRTFQDAIAMTRCLGIKYIWIDSLCIVQDDKRDWEVEAAKMGTVYNNATLVIAATAAVDGDGGLFLPKSQHATITGTDRDQRPFEVFVRRTIPHSALDGEADATVLAEYPLFKRAWCFQERILGRKIIHFTKYEVVYECLTSLRCECGSLSGDSENSLLELRRDTSSFPRDASSAPLKSTGADATGLGLKEDGLVGQLPELFVSWTASDEASMFLEWRNLVSEFSSKSITFYSDWLPALAGLASRWGGFRTGPYLAGIWSRDILRSLLWIPVGPNRDDHDFIAPSWSWPSVQRAVRWPPPANDRWEGALRSTSTYFVQVDLKKSKVLPSGLATFGQVKGGWLFLTGLVAEVTLAEFGRDESSGTSAYVTVDEWKTSEKYRSFNLANATQVFHVDDRRRCSMYLGSKLLWLKYCKDGGHDRAIILGAVPDDTMHDLPPALQSHTRIYQRLGIVERVNKDVEPEDSLKPLSMYIV